MHTIFRILFLQNTWLTSTPCEFLQTLELVGQLTASLNRFYKKEIAIKSISYLGSEIWNDLN